MEPREYDIDRYVEKMAAHEAEFEAEYEALVAAEKQDLSVVQGLVKAHSIVLPEGLDAAELAVNDLVDFYARENLTEPARDRTYALLQVTRAAGGVRLGDPEPYGGALEAIITAPSFSDDEKAKWIRVLEGATGQTVLTADDNLNRQIIVSLEPFFQEAAYHRAYEHRLQHLVQRQMLEIMRADYGEHDHIKGILNYVMICATLQLASSTSPNAQEVQPPTGLKEYIGYGYMPPEMIDRYVTAAMRLLQAYGWGT